MNIFCLSGQSVWLRMAINAGHQLGQEVLKVIISELSYSQEIISIEQKIKSKYDELVEELNTHLDKLVHDFVSSELVSELIQEIGGDETRSELILTLTQDDFCVEESQHIETCIQNYSALKLDMVRNWTFEKKNLTSKTQLYLKHVEKFLSGGSRERDGGQSDDLVEEIGRSIFSILRKCINSINNSLALKETQGTPKKSSSNSKYENKSIAFEISNIFCRRLEQDLYEVFLAPVCYTVTNNFLRDADATLIRRLSQSRRNLVKSFTTQQNFNRLFLPKLGKFSYILHQLFISMEKLLSIIF